MPRIPGRFTVERPLGSGGFGVVYQVWDHKRNARVALKTLNKTDPVHLYRIKQEFRSLAGIVHPNLVTLYELLTEEDGQWGYTMELIEGRNFLEHIRGTSAKESGTGTPTLSIEHEMEPDPVTTLPERAEAAFVQIDFDGLRDALKQLIAGLSALHRMGKLHCDIKPSNVLVEAGGRVVLLDFGLVAEAEATPRPGTISGTLHYMAPELASGIRSEASDWYSVGVILHQCLTGSYPAHGVAPLSGYGSPIPPDLKDLCVRLLESDPDERPIGVELLAGWVGGTAFSYATRHNFVGRSAELAVLWEAYASTSRGHPAVVRLSGSSGIGKSALLRQFQQELKRREPRTVQLLARCFDRESVRYKALDGAVDGLSRWLIQLHPAELERYIPADISALARVFPVLGHLEGAAGTRRRSAGVSDVQELRRRAFGALRETLSRISTVRPVAVFIDDLQWSDVDSVPIFQTLLREPDAPPILLVPAYRAEEAGNPVMRELRRVLEAAGGPEIRLGVLTEEEARSLALALGSGKRAEAVVREAAGNPFLIDALLRHNEDDEAPTLENVIERQIARLPEQGRLVVELLATAGRPVRPDMFQGEADPRVFSLLMAEHLVRSRGTGDEIEPYHDRIRETVASRLPVERARAHHLWLARAFARQEVVEPERVALHFQAAGDSVAASPYAEAAAERAMQTLAFNQAVLLFGIALENPELPAEKARLLRRRMGDALTDAGRAPEAAAAYTAAATGAPTAERIELLRLAGERLLVSGHFDEGYETMRLVLRTVGLKFPATPRAALWSLIWRRTFLRFRGLRFKERPAASIPERRLQVMDACSSLVAGLAPIDPVRAMAFQARLMMNALRVGEPVRLARALAREAVILGAGGSKTWDLTMRAMRAAERLIEATGDPSARYMLACYSGEFSFFAGKWEESLARFRISLDLRPPAGDGSDWAVNSGKLCALVAWIYSGNLAALYEQLPGMLADSRSRGDLHAETSMRCRCSYVPLLARGQPDRVYAEVTDAIGGWSQKGYHMQHFWAMLARVEADIYRGDGRAAWERIQTDWPLLTGSLLIKIQLIMIEARHLRARAALAFDAAGGGGQALPRQALEDAQAIEREKTRWAEGLALLIRAGVERANGGSGVELLARAESSLAEHGMRLFEAAAARRRGEMEGDAERVRAADAFMAAQGIVDAARFTDVLAPMRVAGGSAP